jgi:hypothetical protein
VGAFNVIPEANPADKLPRGAKLTLLWVILYCVAAAPLLLSFKVR